MKDTETYPRLVSCTDHGERRAAFVCKHIVLQLKDNAPRGATWSFDSTEVCFSAYCDACKLMLNDDDEEIPDEIAKKMEVVMICEECLDRVLNLNGMTRSN